MSKLSKAIANAIIEFNAGLLTQDELHQKYDVREHESEEVQEYDRTHCSIEKPYSEEEIQKRLKEGNGIKTYSTCVGVPLSMIEEIIID